MEMNKCSSEEKRSKLKQIKIRVTEDTYELICSIAKKHNLKIAVLIRAALEDKLEKFNEKYRYNDTEQGERIETYLREISNELRLILNNIKRIGVNYNQDVKLKNAERKYKTIADDVSMPLTDRTKALEEYNKKGAEQQRF